MFVLVVENSFHRIPVKHSSQPAKLFRIPSNVKPVCLAEPHHFCSTLEVRIDVVSECMSVRQRAHGRITWIRFGLCGAPTAQRYPEIQGCRVYVHSRYKGLRSGCHAAKSHLPQLELPSKTKIGDLEGLRTASGPGSYAASGRS
jgi:hypothetical protein